MPRNATIDDFGFKIRGRPDAFFKVIVMSGRSITAAGSPSILDVGGLARGWFVRSDSFDYMVSEPASFAMHGEMPATREGRLRPAEVDHDHDHGDDHTLQRITDMRL